jgi:predicted nucleotidyltransferase
MTSDLHAKRFVMGTGQTLRWPTARSEAWTNAFVDRTDRDGNIIAIVAVGSAVRPDVASVDLDLIVVCKEPDKLATKAPIEVDLRAYPAVEIWRLVEPTQHFTA